MEYDMNKIFDLKKSYLDLEKYLDKIVFVCRDKSDLLEISDMNRWLLEVINFYSKCGINIDYNTFKDFHRDNVSLSSKRNDKINKYMSLFFKNIDSLDSYEFPKLLFSFDDMDIDNSNPIYEEIVILINNFNNRNKDIFNKLLLELEYKYSFLGLDRKLFRYDKMLELKDIVSKRILVIDKKIEELYYKYKGSSSKK